MNGEIITSIDIKVYQEVIFPDGGRIILANPAFGWLDKKLDASNHNVFRLNTDNQVVWQVRREESGCVDWESRHRHAKAKDPTCEGYFDPFWGMSMGDELGKYDPSNRYRPGCEIYLQTRWWAYHLDPETGIATCTGDQIK